jgi:hypothetical protein
MLYIGEQGNGPEAIVRKSGKTVPKRGTTFEPADEKEVAHLLQQPRHTTFKRLSSENS